MQPIYYLYPTHLWRLCCINLPISPTPQIHYLYRCPIITSDKYIYIYGTPPALSLSLSIPKDPGMLPRIRLDKPGIPTTNYWWVDLTRGIVRNYEISRSKMPQNHADNVLRKGFPWGRHGVLGVYTCMCIYIYIYITNIYIYIHPHIHYLHTPYTCYL